MTQTLGLATRTAREENISEPGIHLILPAPTFAEVRKLEPERGLFFSTLLHICAVAALVWLPLFAPVKPVPLYVRSIEPVDLVSIPYPNLAPLPALGDQGAKAGSSPSHKASPGPAAKASAAASQPGRTLAYAGQQEIISDPPDATNDVQTIRRPDIIEPMKIKNPVRLRSRVEIPTPPVVAVKAAVPDWITHPTTQPVKPEPAEITSNAPPVERAVLVVRKSERAPRIVDVAPPSVVPDAKNAAPVLSAAPGNAPTLAKAVVVINAVEVPADPAAKIPDGEISGRFAVTPLVAAVRAPDPNGTGTGDSAAANGAGAKSGNGSAGTSGQGSSAGTGAGSASGASGDGKAGSGKGGTAAGTGSGTSAGTGTGTGSGSGPGNAPGTGSGTGTRAGNGSTGGGGVGNGRGAGLSGISISGGASGRGSTHTAAGGSRSYGLTVISAGNNGGPSRDSGAFVRDETVYTVYVPMRDVGGGADWSMQYALAGATNTKGLLTPPFPTKKVKAERSVSDLGLDSSPVFIAGTIDAEGNLQKLRPSRVSDQRSQAAIAVLEQWKFTPAKLDGQAVEAKVLIGVMLTTAVTSTRGTR